MRIALILLVLSACQARTQRLPEPVSDAAWVIPSPDEPENRRYLSAQVEHGSNPGPLALQAAAKESVRPTFWLGVGDPVPECGLGPGLEPGPALALRFFHYEEYPAFSKDSCPNGSSCLTADIIAEGRYTLECEAPDGVITRKDILIENGKVTEIDLKVPRPLHPRPWQ